MADQHIGNRIPHDEAGKRADMIVIGELTSAGPADPGPPGEAFYYDARLKVVKDLSGDVSGEQPITFSAHRLPGETQEHVPEKGERFLFFLERQPDGSLHAIKAVPATEEAVQRAALIAHR